MSANEQLRWTGGRGGEGRGEMRIYIYIYIYISGVPREERGFPLYSRVTWLERHQVHFDVTSNDDSSE